MSCDVLKAMSKEELLALIQSKNFSDDEMDYLIDTLKKQCEPSCKIPKKIEDASTSFQIAQESERFRPDLQMLQRNHPEIYRYWTRPKVMACVQNYATSHGLSKERILVEIIQQDLVVEADSKNYVGKSSIHILDDLYQKRDVIYQAVARGEQKSSHTALPLVAEIHRRKRILSIWTIE